MNDKIYIYKLETNKYPDGEDFFSPSVLYPEYKFDSSLSSTENQVYDAVRNIFHRMGYDESNFGTPNWNPLKAFVNKGDTVLIKPNLVFHENRSRDGGMECLVTHPSVVRPVLDYVITALDGTGTLLIGDAPIQNCDFEKLKMNAGYERLADFYRERGIRIELLDFRNYKSCYNKGIFIGNQDDKENETVIVDLGAESAFASLSQHEFSQLRITNYNPEIMLEHHNQYKNEYLIAKQVLKADVIINMPKPKTHRKAGITVSLKNVVGINANKEWLPHHKSGSLSGGGDEYRKKSYLKSLNSRLLDKKNLASANQHYLKAHIYHLATGTMGIVRKKMFRDKTFEGSWYGNDTIWRTIWDLNRILFYADQDGVMKKEIQRKMLIIADMVVSGEKEGPLEPSPKHTGIIVAGENPVLLDEVVCTFMGEQAERYPSIYNAKYYKQGLFGEDLTESEARIYSNYEIWNDKTRLEISKDTLFHFIMSDGWRK